MAADSAVTALPVATIFKVMCTLLSHASCTNVNIAATLAVTTTDVTLVAVVTAVTLVWTAV